MKIVANVENTIFRNAENGYSVLNLSFNNKRLTAVGNMPEVFEGQTLELTGEFIVNKKFGEQFSVNEVKIVEPTSLPAIEKYLASGLIYGIGPITAKKIVEEFKEDTLAIMEFNPLRLSQIRGISKQKAIEISNAYNEMKEMQNVVMFLQSHFITTNMAIKTAFYGLDLKAIATTKRLCALLKDITKVILAEINQENGTDYQLKDVEFNFERTSLTNESENIQNQKTEAETEQIRINTILNVAVNVGDEQTLKAICDVMDWDFEELQSQIEKMQEESGTQNAKTALETVVPEEDDIDVE